MCPLTSALMACETLPDGEREKKVGVPSCLHGRRALSLTEGHTDPLHSSCRLCPGNHGNHPSLYQTLFWSHQTLSVKGQITDISGSVNHMHVLPCSSLYFLQH